MEILQEYSLGLEALDEGDRDAAKQHFEAALKQDSIEIVVQVNGKLRSRFSAPTDADESQLKQAALDDERIVRFIDGKPIRKVIVVKNKLVNIVV